MHRPLSTLSCRSKCGELASDPMLDRLSLPGRYAAMTLEQRW